MKNIFLKILLVIFLLIFLASSALLIKELIERRTAVVYHSDLHNEYVPDVLQPPSVGSKPSTPAESAPSLSDDTDELRPNPTIQHLVSKYPDVVGWLTCEGAEISEPFVYSIDNTNYLRADLDGEYIVSGTPFLDYRNHRELVDNVSVIYAHNMNNGTVFGKLAQYRNQAHLEQYPDVYVSFPDYTAHYTAFACNLEDAENCMLYDTLDEHYDTLDILNYILVNFEFVNDGVPLGEHDSLLVLSTCSPEFFYARTVLVCVLDSIY